MKSWDHGLNYKKRCYSMNTPLVSVVLSTYNDERFIAGAIESVLNQTYQNFEFIIWNDGSTDKTEDIIKSYQDNRIIYFYHENTGLGQALRMACQEAKGKYIARFDGDDLCMPNRLEKEVSFMENHPDYVLISSNFITIDDNGNEYGRSYLCTWDKSLRKQFRFSSPIIHPASMFRTSVYKQTDGYLNMRRCQDHFLFAQMIKYGKVANLKEPLIKYRPDLVNLMGMTNNNPYRMVMAEYRLKMLNDDVVDEKDLELYNEICRRYRRKTEVELDLSKRRVSRAERLNKIVTGILGEKIGTGVLILARNLYVTLLK